MTPLTPSETSVLGNWITVDGRVTGDHGEKRIQWLEAHSLVKCATGNWTVLYRDPNDGRLWELFFRHGGTRGGGPRALRVVGVDEARSIYGDAVDRV